MNKYTAEFFGTAFLVFAGCGAIIVNDLFGQVLGHLGVSMVFGLIVMAVIYSIGNVSGAHINPAVTIGFWAAKRIKFKEVPLYVLSQILGALLAAGVLKFLFFEHQTLGSTLPMTGIQTVFVMEVTLSFMLMFVILNVSVGHLEKGIMAGAAIGGIIALEALIGGPISGASMNPARSIGPALVSGNLQYLWLYILAPIVGTVLAAPCCRLIQGEDCCDA